jgi:hypothetical protein
MPFDFQRARPLLQTGNLAQLFVEELGWEPCRQKLTLRARDTDHALTAIAEKRGFTAWLCASAGSRLPDHTTRLKLDRALAQTSFEHLIVFATADLGQQSWVWVRREPGRPLSARTHEFNRGQPGDSLLAKLQILYVSLEEEEAGLTITQMAGRAQAAFDIERVTKAFYREFDTHRKAFLKFIDGIDEVADREWYASVMLNRLMFVYFIQRKGFLDADPEYLRNRLQRCQQEKGKDKFYTFYRYFLLRLFHEGFGKRRKDRAPDLEKLLGNIPYLNGGLFDVHELEKPDRYGKDIQIPDKAFERVFDYFDQYQWYLDERPLRADNEINPDVLGYIFEKYINQKQMGAYYTKEDITEYISKSTVLPFLFDAARARCKVAFDNPDGPTVWDLLPENPDRYIYPAVRHGADNKLPTEIAAGLDTTKPDLIERRKTWNKPAPGEYALPAETWREVVARRQRYEEVRKKLAAGEVRDINDFITLNLDLRQFAQDVIQNCEGPDLLMAFWQAIISITILDPTGGSGAFIFAALNVLEPLYEACLDRMEAFLAEWGDQGKKLHPNYHKKFTEVLARVAAHPNRRYFVLKSIILNNLYAVDIMEEAVEICKLRLFLKLAAQVEPDAGRDNLGIEPLPDIDFNIRAGNTLVGYATKQEVQRCMKEVGGGQMKLMDEADLGSFARFNTRCADVEQAFAKFRQLQTEGDGSVPHADKIELQKRLRTLEEELNRHLAGECGVKVSDKAAYANWVESHQPFHWFIQFYGIMNGGGFDVIIGNPPYAEIPKELGRLLLRKTFKTALERWSRDEDLYTLVVERSLSLSKPHTGKYGMILPLSVAFSTKKPFIVLRDVLASEKGLWLWSHFDRIPSALFGNEVRTRCTIAVLSRFPQAQRFGGATTALLRWNAEYRECLFQTLRFSLLDLDISAGIPKVASQVQADVLKALLQAKSPLATDLSRSIPFNDLASVAPRFPQPCVYVGGTAYNWFPAWRDIPETTNMDGEPSLPARTAGFRFSNEEQANIVFALLCSSMGYWWWAVASDAFNLKKWLMERFPVSVSMIPAEARKPLAKLGEHLRRELKSNYVYKDNKGRIGNFFLPACEDEIVAIDTFLGTAVPTLSVEFFRDVRNFNSSFSRAELGEAEAEEEEAGE